MVLKLTDEQESVILINHIEEMHRRGGVHTWPVFREKMAGENLQPGSMEVVSEQWAEREDSAAENQIQ